MKAYRRCVLAAVACFTALAARAAPVEWNAFTLGEVFDYNDHDHQSIYAEFPDVMSYPSVCMRVETSGGSLLVSKADSMPSLMAADWVIAVFSDAGDVLTWNYFKNAAEAVQNEAKYAPGAFKGLTTPVISEPVDIDFDTVTYLSILFWTDDTPGYTWCKLTATEDGFTMNANATAFQEGLIVGTGSFAQTPEPSSTMLMLLGIALLATRRASCDIPRTLRRKSSKNFSHLSPTTNYQPTNYNSPRPYFTGLK